MKHAHYSQLNRSKLPYGIILIALLAFLVASFSSCNRYNGCPSHSGRNFKVGYGVQIIKWHTDSRGLTSVQWRDANGKEWGLRLCYEGRIESGGIGEIMENSPRLQCSVCGQWKRLTGTDGMQYFYPCCGENGEFEHEKPVCYECCKKKCPYNKKLNTMTKDELSLLLFLETCHVDQGGLVDVRHMNEDDMKIAKEWHERDYIQFGRLYSKDLEKFANKTHWVTLSDQAFTDAHSERKARAARMYLKRSWLKSTEK